MVSLLLAVIYIAFISLGLPDSLLGSAWPVMHIELGVAISYAGIITMIISVGTIASSLLSDRLTRKLGTGLVTAISVFLTAAALFGFYLSNKFWMFCLWAIPYGLGAGAVDAALNNYVALHYSSRHMSWLHCFWGVGVSISPYIMSFALTRSAGWNSGYLYVSIIQIAVTAILFVSLPLWKKKTMANANSLVEDSVNGTTVDLANAIETANGTAAETTAKIANLEANVTASQQAANATETKTADEAANSTYKIKDTQKSKSIVEIFKIKGVPLVLIAFFGYCAMEVTAGLWASSYLVKARGIDPVTAAKFASLFYLGITFGRFVSGFVANTLGDRMLIRIGSIVFITGIVLIAVPINVSFLPLSGLVILGFGCAPVYPSIIHSTPLNFGKENSQAVIGIQMASAYIGATFMPPLFGLIAQYISIWLYPIYLMFFAVLILVMTELLRRVKA